MDTSSLLGDGLYYGGGKKRHVNSGHHKTPRTSTIVSDLYLNNSPVLLAWLTIITLVIVGLTGTMIWLALRPCSDTTSSSTNSASGSGIGLNQSVVQCSAGNGTIGIKNTTGWYYDDCDAFYIVFSRYATPRNLWAGQTTSVCAYVGEVNPETLGNKFRMAIYGDDGFGIPTTLKASTATEGTIQSESWNCLPISLALGESHYFWTAFMTNGQECGPTNNLYYMPHLQLRSGFSDQFTYPQWPVQISSAQYFSAVYSMYIDYNATCVTSF